MKTLKQDIIKLRCYLTGHKPTKVLTVEFPFGISVITECSRCGNSLGWLKFSDMTSDDARKILKLINEENYSLLRGSKLDPATSILYIRNKMNELKKQGNL